MTRTGLDLTEKTALVLDAMDMAVMQRQQEGVIHHRDQGLQYTSVAFGLRCKEMGVRPSMGSVGDCGDNAPLGRFAVQIACRECNARASSSPSNADCTTAAGFETKAEARVACFEFIEGWYNPSRRHSASGNKSPVNYESKGPPPSG